MKTGLIQPDAVPDNKPEFPKMTIADLRDRLKELSQTATIENFKIVFRDKRDFINIIESPEK